MSDAPPQPAEHPRPPGWTPPVHPPVPVEAAAAIPTASTPAAPAPDQSASRAAELRRMAWVPLIAFFATALNLVLLHTDAAPGSAEVVARMLAVVHMALSIALAVGFARLERWTSRVAIFWGVTLVELQVLRMFENPAYDFVSDLFYTIFCILLAVGMWHEARGIPPAAPSSP